MSGTFNENANWNSEVQRGTNATDKPIHQLQFYLPPKLPHAQTFTLELIPFTS